jgi:hypothetical protein
MIWMQLLSLTAKRLFSLEQSNLQTTSPASRGHSPVSEETDSSPDGSPPRARPVSRMQACERGWTSASEEMERTRAEAEAGAEAGEC